MTEFSPTGEIDKGKEALFFLLKRFLRRYDFNLTPQMRKYWDTIASMQDDLPPDIEDDPANPWITKFHIAGERLVDKAVKDKKSDGQQPTLAKMVATAVLYKQTGRIDRFLEEVSDIVTVIENNEAAYPNSDQYRKFMTDAVLTGFLD